MFSGCRHAVPVTPTPRPPGYQIAYRLDASDPNKFTTVEVGSTAQQFTVTGLSPESAYVFRISARTQQGWGQPEEAVVITTERRGELSWAVSAHWRHPLSLRNTAVRASSVLFISLWNVFQE